MPVEKSLFRFSVHFLISFFFFSILSCMSYLYILDINPLFGHIICKYFLPFHRLPFIFVDGFLCCAKALSLIRSHLFLLLFFFCFCYFALGDYSKNIFIWFRSENIFPVFSSRSFMVSCFIFASFTHFEFIFVYGVRECSIDNFVVLHAAVQLS